MVNILVSSISSKGQVVIPAALRNKFSDKVVFIEDGEQVIIKDSSDFNEYFEEDLKRAKETTKLIDEYEKGKLKTFQFESVEDAVKYLDSI